MANTHIKNQLHLGQSLLAQRRLFLRSASYLPAAAAFAWAALPGSVWAGGQLEEPLSDSVRTALSLAVAASSTPPIPVFADAKSQQAYQNNAWLLEIKRGSGLITLAANLDFIENAAIDDYDHAEFFWHLLHGLHPQPQNVWLIHQDDLPPLWKLLWERAWPLLLTLALAIPLGILALSPRFGPLQAAPTPERRRILEHIHASGRFMWKRHQQGDTQYPAFTDAVEQLSPKPKDTP